MQCPVCQAQVSPQAQACPSCGAAIRSPAAPPVVDAPPLPPPPPYGQPGLQYASPMPPRPMEQDAGMRMLLPVGRSGWAIAAGYLGLFAFVVFPAPLALVVSIIAIMHLRKNRHLFGWGRAIFGLIVGIIFTAVLVLMIVVSIPHPTHSRY